MILGKEYSSDLFSCPGYRGVERQYLPEIPDDKNAAAALNKAIDKFYDLIVEPGEIYVTDVRAAFEIARTYNQFDNSASGFEVVEILTEASAKSSARRGILGWDVIWGESSSLILQLLCSMTFGVDLSVDKSRELKKLKLYYCNTLNEYYLFDTPCKAKTFIEDVQKCQSEESGFIETIPLSQLRPVGILRRRSGKGSSQRPRSTGGPEGAP